MSKTPSYKCILLGQLGVGKSKLLEGIHQHKHCCGGDMKIVLGMFFIQDFYVNGKRIKLQIWDTGEEERFYCLPSRYYRDAFGAILVYDITNRESFMNVALWLDEARENCNPEIPMILVGNKVDIEDKRVVSYKEGERYAKENGMIFFEVSNKTGKNVREVFTKMAELINKRIEASGGGNENSGIKLQNNYQASQNGNCAC